MCYITVATSIFYTLSESKTIEMNNLFSPELLKLSGYPGRFLAVGGNLCKYGENLQQLTGAWDTLTVRQQC